MEYSDTSDPIRDLVRSVRQQDGYRKVASSLCAGESATVDGAWGSSCALVTAALADEAPSCIVVVGAKPERLDDLSDDLRLFSTLQVDTFPAMEAIENQRLTHDDLFGTRIRTIKSIRTHFGLDETESTDSVATGRTVEPRIIATSIQSLLQPVPDLGMLTSRTRMLRTGQSFEIDELVRWLTANGLHRTTAVELPGEFSVRGGLVDIFAIDWYEPVRVEFFGDEIDSIRRFDVASQRSLGALDRIELTTLQPGVGYEAQLLDLLPDDSWLVLVESHELEGAARKYLARLERPQDLHGVSAVMRRVMEQPCVAVENLAVGSLGKTWEIGVESVEKLGNHRLEKVREAIEEVDAEVQVLIVCQTMAEIKRLEEALADTRAAVERRLHFPSGRLDEGFRMIREKTVVIGSAQLFQRKTDLRRVSQGRTGRHRLGKAIDSFIDLKPGDLVVHLSHGIGRYRGVELLDKNGQAEEYLAIEFAEESKVYVPSSKIELVQKYIGGGKTRPQLARLGGQTWLKRKQAVESAVVDLAADMLELQATRQARPGIAFPVDSIWQHEFDASFPYQETDDQLHAIAAIKSDMSESRPMDRLICGDVGFGKTEMAMRAAFKAVDAGYQVAVLVPTTVLAEQHYRTFTDRMAEFPFEIASLSRFQSKKQQAQIVSRLSDGSIDIVIGTHRLASRDVQFSNLGLVVIDEEQRFGVEIKERLKTLRHVVDVLTMTATPIPRTLHFSLLGIRDISNLETAPEDRIAIETRVTRFKDDLVRHAILRELNRNGQIYFVHNRVRDIRRVAANLQRIVPEARIEIGHAQMPIDELERVMMGFVNHEFDLLLSTTIVESGLDIPNANTIFIDEADHFGLSELHQLRGRVGRYKHQAYCYLLIDPTRHLTPVAARRLHAVEEFSQLGAGFSLAMRDLEIRGAGNILGTQQSGHIALVGYELYCQLLENAVRRMKQMPPRTVIEVDLELPGRAFLPSDYVADMRTKIDLYRRLARATTDADLTEYRRELQDRFGRLPSPVTRMLDLSSLRIAAHHWNISAIRLEEDFLFVEYTKLSELQTLVSRIEERFDLDFRLVDSKTGCFELEPGQREPDALLKMLKSMLQ